MVNSYKATEVNTMGSIFFSFMLSSAHGVLNSSLSLWWISNWLQHSAACCMGGPARAGIVGCAFPEVFRENWIHTLLSHNKKLSLSPQITNTGNISPSAMWILVCTATSFTVNNEVAYCCTVYLLKYSYFKNTWISFKFFFFFTFKSLLLSNFSELWFWKYAKVFWEHEHNFFPLSSPVATLEQVRGSTFQMVTYKFKIMGAHLVRETETTSKREGIHLSGKSRFKPLM